MVKLDLPNINVMVERAKAKTNCKNDKLLNTFAKAIIELDKTAKVNAIKGVAGMRSYFFWIDAVTQNTNVIDALYHKVIYKITTDQDEIKILEQALSNSNVFEELEKITSEDINENRNVMEIHTEGNIDANFLNATTKKIPQVTLRKSKDSEGNQIKIKNSSSTQFSNTDEDGNPIYHELLYEQNDELNEKKWNFVVLE